MQNANYSPEPRLCSFVPAQFETSLLLAPSRLKTAAEGRTDHHNNGCFKCDRNRCDLCKNFFVESKYFPSLKTGKKYTIYSSLSCDSKNVIYLASCKKCRLQYVGSTTTDFRIRFRNPRRTCKSNAINM